MERQIPMFKGFGTLLRSEGYKKDDLLPLTMPTDRDAQTKFINTFTEEKCFMDWAILTEIMKIPLDMSAEGRCRELVLRCFSFMTWLENLKPYPELKTQTNIVKHLEYVYKHPEKYHFPDTLRYRAETLVREWERVNWGLGRRQALEREAEQTAAAASASASSTSASATANKQVTNQEVAAQLDLATRRRLQRVRVSQDPNHPIYGLNGIMHGVCRQEKGAGWMLDKRYTAEKRRADVFGHNGLQVGDWFPTQLVALFKGAHGMSMAGIFAHKDGAAFSVVVSGKYEDLDSDRGSVLWYSGPHSHENDKRNQLSDEQVRGGRPLHISMREQTPVRVLRTSTGASRYKPSVGIRYDGLYMVTRVNERFNKYDGLYEQFKLDRVPDQTPLPQLSARSPTSQQVRDFRRMKEDS